MKEYAEAAFPDEASSITMGDDETQRQKGIETANINSDEVIQEKDDEDVPSEQDDEQGVGDDGSEDDTGGEGDDSPSLSEEDLGAFDPEDEEQIARYDEAFADEDGFPDLEGKLSAHFWKNREADKEGLDEGVYQYLESKGIKRSTVKQVEAMAVTNKDATEQSVVKQDEALFEVAGGADELAKALAWGKAGGYSKEQQARFNKLASGKDLEAKKEAVEVLMARYAKANPPERPRVPQRDATKNGGKKSNGALPFKDRGEMRHMRDSLRENDSAGWALFRKRRAASNF